MATFNQILILFLLILIGYASKRLKIISDNMNTDMTNFILYITIPALMITSLSSYEFSKEMLLKGGKLLLLSWGVYAFSILFSYGIIKIFKLESATRDVFQFMVVFSNVAFMGLPVINAVYGTEGVFYTTLYNLPFNILIWTFGVMVLSRSNKESIGGDGKGVAFKVLLNPGIIAVGIGFLMFLTSTRLPGPIHETLVLLGSLTTPLSMFFIGTILADMDIKDIFTNKNVFIGASFRLVIVPLIVLVFLKALKFEGIILGIPVIITAMPVAANCSIMAAKYGSDYKFASQSVFISTMLSLITIPWIISLL